MSDGPAPAARTSVHPQMSTPAQTIARAAKNLKMLNGDASTPPPKRAPSKPKADPSAGLVQQYRDMSKGSMW